MRIAIGMIVRDILSAHPLTDFLDNAEKHGHALDRVIVIYSHQADPRAVEELRSRTNLSLIKLQSNERAHLIMKEIGVRHSSIHQLLYCPLIDAHGLIPYGFNRNQALMEAMFTGTDYLILWTPMCGRRCCARRRTGRFSPRRSTLSAHICMDCLWGLMLPAAITAAITSCLRLRSTV